MTARVNGDRSGGVAQLGERLNGIQEVRGSIPLASIVGRPCSGGEPAWTLAGPDVVMSSGVRHPASSRE